MKKNVKQQIKKYIPKIIVGLLKGSLFKFEEFRTYIARSVKTHFYEGYPLNIYIFNTVSKNWYDHDWERDEIKFLRNKAALNEGSRVFNIGAHHGVVALIFSKIVGNKGEVVAVEMDKNHVAAAKVNRSNNNASNLRIVHAAVSEESSPLTFSNDQVVQNSQSLHGKRARTTSVDGLTKKFGVPNVIYVDVEGYECHVLKSAKRTLKYYPDWCLEVHVKNGLESFGGSVNEIVSYFPLDSYNLYMAPALDKCKFERFNEKSRILDDRFYLIALKKRSSARA